MQGFKAGPTLTIAAPHGRPDDAVRDALQGMATARRHGATTYPALLSGWTAAQAVGAWVNGNGSTVTERVTVYSVTVEDERGPSLVLRYVAGRLARVMFDADEQAVYLAVGGHGAIVTEVGVHPDVCDAAMQAADDLLRRAGVSL